jgi:hypothetical protein
MGSYEEVILELSHKQYQDSEKYQAIYNFFIDLEIHEYIHPDLNQCFKSYYQIIENLAESDLSFSNKMFLILEKKIQEKYILEDVCDRFDDKKEMTIIEATEILKIYPFNEYRLKALEKICQKKNNILSLEDRLKR